MSMGRFGKWAIGLAFAVAACGGSGTAGDAAGDADAAVEAGPDVVAEVADTLPETGDAREEVLDLPAAEDADAAPPEDVAGDEDGTDAEDATDAIDTADAVDAEDVPVDVGLAEVRAPTLGQWFGIEELPVPNDSGFFRTAMLDGRWVLATPGGLAFLSIGPTTVAFDGDVGQGMTYSSMSLANRARWGEGEAGRRAFYEAALKELQAAGFNTVAGWSNEVANRIAAGQMDMPYTVSLQFAARGTAVNKNGFPDTFDPAFAQACRDYAASAAAPFRDDPNLIGYFTDNELRWWGEDLYWEADDRGLTDDYLRLAADAPGKQAWVAFLQQDRGYADVAAANAAWGTAFASWDEVAAATTLANDAAWPARQADKKEFVYAIARAYFETVNDALKAADPNHLNLCVRYASTAPIEVSRSAAPCDVLSINDYYTDDDEFTTGLFRATPEERWTGFALAAGGGTTPKPTLMTEFGMRATDSMMPNGWGAGFVVGTQSGRGTYYRRTLDRLMGFRAGGVGFVVGFHWFEWRDEPKTGRWDGEDSNYGLIGVDGGKYGPVWESMASHHAAIADRLLGGTAPVLGQPKARVANGDDGRPAVSFAAVPGAVAYDVRVSPVPWMTVDVPWAAGVAASDRQESGATERMEAPGGTLSIPRAAGSWWATVTARNDGLAFPSDPSVPVRFESPRDCPQSYANASDALGCFTLPAAMDEMTDDGWARVAAGSPSMPADWLALRFTASTLAKSHPRNGGPGAEIVVRYEPSAPLSADAVPRFCAGPVVATDGIREPASRFLRLRLKGMDGSVLSEGPLDPEGAVAIEGCQEAAAPAPGPVAAIEWVLPTAEARLPLDVPIELAIGPFPVAAPR